MDVSKHLRNTFLAGAFAAMPIAATVFIVYYVESTARNVLGVRTPFVALGLAVAAIYVLGLVVRSIVGKFFIAWIDRILSRIPLLRDAYEAWKHVSITPGGREGIFAKAVLIKGEGNLRLLGFFSGEPVEGDPETFCVFVPNAPNPVTGRLYFAARKDCLVLEGVAMEEAFKSLLSTGNYVPPALGPATAKSPLPAPVARSEGFVRT